jgi:hypothetical protein
LLEIIELAYSPRNTLMPVRSSSMIIVMVQIKLLHGLVNPRVPREMNQQFHKVEQRNTNPIDEQWKGPACTNLWFLSV